MSKNSRQAREVLTPPNVTRYVPDYFGHCVACGAMPTVLGSDDNGKVIHFTGLCGGCTWGVAEMSDPDNW